MKRTLIALAIFAACGASFAQHSGSTSGSQAGASASAGGSSSGATAAGGSAGASAGIGDITNGATGGSSTATTGASTAVTGPASASNAGNNAHTAVNINQAASVIPDNTRVRITSAPSMGAPALAAPAPFSCLGSKSVALSVMGGGLAGGGTHEDPRCDAREDAKLLNVLGLQDVAIARLCQVADIARALADSSRPCPEKRQTAQAPVVAPQAPVATSTDPYIARRLASK